MRQAGASAIVEEGSNAVAGRSAASAPFVQAANAHQLCTHCGQPCGGGAVVRGGISFCCAGCQAVFALLSESGLSRYYELASAPGTRIGDINRQSQWAYLDDPKIQEKLLDYAGEGRGKMTLHLPAIHCVACVWLLENLFRLLPGIRESRVNFLRREVAVTFAREQVKPSEIAALLTSLGYEPQLTFGELERVAERSAPHHRRQWLQLGVAGFGFGNAMLLALPGYLGLDSASGPWFRIFAGWLGLGLALPVLVYSAGDYWRAARLSFKQRVLTLDVPIALGLAAIYAQSVFEVFSKREGYADSLTGLIFFLLCGRAFQQKTFARLAFDRDYKGFFPLSVVRKTEEKAEPVAISQVATGDRLLIRHGELVPADARLAAGEALIDYSFVTGESEPISRKTGETLYAGGRQISGAIEIETIKPVSESYLTSLWNSEAFHKQDGDDLDSLTNRYSKRFTAVVVAAAIGAGTFWLFSDATMALKAVTSVLIVACPCALALAAPLTLGTALRALAARGLFLRNAQVVERMAAADVIAFDKTGTLTTTEGGEAVWKGAPLSDGEAGDVRSLAQHSAHPLARRIEQTLPSSRCDGPVRTFLEIPGRGMRGSLGSSEILLGSGPWLQSCGIPDVLMNANQGVDSAVSAGSVHLAINGRYRGQFVLEGVLRPEVESLVRALQKTHQIILLSGDNSREKGRFSELLGAGARIEFNQSPFDKLRAIEELQNAGHKVMMVGDGLNDAGALKQADVGVAVVERTGAFSPASDVILEASQLPQLARSLRFSTQATRIVRLGFVLSGLYNVVGITIAAAGLLSPLVCAVLMPLSSATVVLFSAGTTRWAARRTLGSRASATVGGQASNLGALEGRRNAAASKRLRHPQSLSIAPNTKEAVS